MSSAPNYRYLLTTACILLGVGLGTWQLNRDALWYDEIATYYFVGAAQYEPLLSPLPLLERIMLTDRWPPLFYFMLVGWSELTGWNAYTGRVLSLFFGAMIIACTYRLTLDTANTCDSTAYGKGVTAALLLSTSAFFVYYLHELRTYTLYPLLVLLSMIAYWHVLHRITWWGGLAFVAAVVSALYSHPTAYVMIFALGMYHLLFARRYETWARVLVLFAIAAVLTLPWLLVLYYKLGQGQTIGQTTPLLPLVAFFPAYGNGVAVILVAAVAYAAWFLRGRGVGFIAFMLVGTMVVTVLLNIAAPFLFHMRHLIGVLPLLLILCAAAAVHAAAKRPYVVSVLVGVWVVAGIWNSFDWRYMLRTPGHEPTIPQAAMDTLVGIADNCIAPDDAVVLHIGEPMSRGLEWEWIHDVVMVYYWRDVPFRFAHISTLDPITNDDPMGEDPQTQVTDLSEYAPKAARYTEGAARVWLLKLKRLPEIEQTELLNAVLAENGYAAHSQVIDTQHVIGWVYTQDDNPITCDPTAPALDVTAGQTGQSVRRVR